MKYNKELYPFTSRRVDINGESIHYVDEGTGPIILFSHAPLGSSFMYREFIKYLSKRHRCIALDYPGFGLSSNQEEKKYNIETQSEILFKFIKYKKISNIIALGHDTGGPTIFKVAVDHPDLFAALILTDTIIYPTAEYPKIHRMLGLLGNTTLQALNAATNFIARLTFRFGVRTRKLSDAEKQQYWDLFHSASRRKRITELLFSLKQQSYIMNQIKNGFKNQLAATPILLMYGEDDPVTKMGIPTRIHQSHGRSELYLIKGEGHFPHEGQPLEMCRIIEKWIMEQETFYSRHPIAGPNLMIPS